MKRNILILITALLLAITCWLYYLNRKLVNVKDTNIEQIERLQKNRQYLSLKYSSSLNIKSVFPKNGVFDNNGESSLYVIRVSKDYCQKCVDEFVDSIFIRNDWESKIVIAASVNIPSDIEVYKRKYGSSINIVRVESGSLPFDDNGEPYFFEMDNNGDIKNVCFFHINSYEEIRKIIKSGADRQYTPLFKGAFAFEEMVKNIPHLKKGDSIEVVFKYVNNSKDSVAIERVVSGCECAIGKWDNKLIPPKGGGDLRFTVKAYNSGVYYRECRVYLNKMPEPIVLVIKTNN